MIAHVAEAGEHSGRVVVWLDPLRPARLGDLEAPVRFAAAYGSEVETLTLSLPPGIGGTGADVPLGRVLLPTLAAADPQAGDLISRRQRRAIDDVGARCGVPVRHAEADGEAVDRLAEMCLARGPWNIIALPSARAASGSGVVGALFANVSGATALLITAERTLSDAPRIAVIVEDAARMPAMLRAAAWLTRERGTIHALAGAETHAEQAELEGHLRLAAPLSGRLLFEPAEPTLGVKCALLARLAAIKADLIIARFGGTAIADGAALAQTTRATRAPVLLVR